MEKIEDRVFGRPETFPPASLASRASTTMDLFSVSVEGAEVVYAAEGTITRPPLVFVHGWGASHKFFKHCFAAFSPRFRCIAPDLVGFGLSGKPRRDYSIEATAAWLAKFLDALGLRRVTLVGHSMGGAIALLFALDHPDRVERLAVVNPVVRGATAFTLKTRGLALPVVRHLIYAFAHLHWMRRWVAKDFSFVQRLESDLVDDIVRSTFASVSGSLLSMLRVDLVPRIGALAVPTLAIGTDEDRIIAPDQIDLLPTARKERIAHTGHIPMLERPEEFNRLLGGFLRE